MTAIRPAEPHDADELARLQAQYHAERFGPGDLAAFRGNFSRFAHEALSAGWTAWVVEGSDGLEGAVWCHHDIGREGHARDWVAMTRLYVDPLADEHAIASALIAHVLDWAREAGLRSVVAWPSPEQSELFVEAGFRPEGEDAFVAPLTAPAATSAGAGGGHGSVDAADHALAETLAMEAGRLLVAIRAERGFDDPQRLRDEGDRRSHDLVVGLLADLRPGDAVVSEEDTANEGEPSAPPTGSRVWIVDPLDGTREFSEAGRTDWAVHVALCVDGVPVAGAVALPAEEMTFSTADPPQPPGDSGRLRLAVSRTRRPAPILDMAERLGADLVEMGSAGAKSMAVVRGDVEVYAHTGGQYEWDSAAPVAVAAAAGLHASRLDGSPLVYGRPGSWLPDLLVCRNDLAEQVLAVAAEVGFGG